VASVELEADTFVVVPEVVVGIVNAGVVAAVLGGFVVIEEVSVALVVGVVVASSMVTFIVFSVGDAVSIVLGVLVERPVLVFCELKSIAFIDVGPSCSAVEPFETLSFSAADRILLINALFR